ncbi:MAG: hypothetical protein RIT24_1363, partial [Planctomycetota bacterium]
MVPWPRREDAPRDRGQERVDAQRAEAEARERLDERIKQLREQGEAAPPAVLAELAAAIYQRNGRHESAETTRVLKVLETAIRSLGSRASLDLWERLGIEYYPQIDSKKDVLLNPTFRAIAASVAPRVEALAGTVSGQDTIRLAIALRGVARWRSSDASKSQQLQDAQYKNPKEGVQPARTRAERPSLAGMPVWQSEFKRAIKEGVAGARDAYAECVRWECRVMELQWLQDFVSEYGQVDGLCLIEVKEILAERYLRETNAPELQARGVEIIEDLLRIPTWSSWGCRSGLHEVVAGIPQGSPLARGDVIPRLMQRNIAIGGPDGIYFRGSERLTRARDGDAAAMLEVADWCDPALHPGACMSPVGRLVDLDERRSLLWRVRAACSGDGSAAYAVGLMALDGRGCAPSHPIALRWFRLAASRGSVSALRAIVREMGRGGIEAQQESVDWCEPLARAGEPDAMFLLGTQQLREALVSDTAGAANAFALIEGAAKGGSVGAMVFLADRYASMPQVGPAALQALYWRQEAAESGDIRSMVEFARALPGNCDDSKRLSRALELVGNAVDQGAPDAESVALALLDRTDQCGEQRLNALE